MEEEILRQINGTAEVVCYELDAMNTDVVEIEKRLREEQNEQGKIGRAHV